MIDIRYHLVSLIAVFLALSLGIILGTVIVDKGIIVEQQKALVSDLQNEFDELRLANRELQRELDRANEFESAVYDQVISGKLEDKNIVIISTTNISESLQAEIRKSLNKSGAEAFFIKIKKSNYNSKSVSKIENFFTEENLNQDEMWQKLLTRVASDISTSRDSNFLKFLEKEKILYISGSLTIPTNNVVIFGGRDKDEKVKFEDIDKILIESFLDFEVNVVGVETTKVEKSFMRNYQNAGLSTVDNIETIPGRVAMIYVIAGNSGRYGIKNTAQSLLPPIMNGSGI